MHTCPPPIDALRAWLKDKVATNGSFGHLLLEEGSQWTQIIDDLRPYFESAHRDAREYFHQFVGIDLHPDADEIESIIAYPNSLPSTTRRGLFGEVMAGLITESYDFVGNHRWSIPIFLFRYHDDVERYLFSLVRNPTRTRAVYGRHGSDFIGLCLGEDGEVLRIIAGEAKWRNKLRRSVVEELLHGEWTKTDSGKRVRSGKGIWYEVNRDTPAPHGLKQLQRLLQENAPVEFATTIASLDKLLALRPKVPIPRTDLILIVGNDVPSRNKGEPLIPSDQVPYEYMAGNDLQIVEIFLNRGDELIDQLYDSLWVEESTDAPE